MSSKMGTGACLHGLAHLKGDVVRVHLDLHYLAALVSDVQPGGAVRVGDLLPSSHIHGACQACIAICESQADIIRGDAVHRDGLQSTVMHGTMHRLRHQAPQTEAV